MNTENKEPEKTQAQREYEQYLRNLQELEEDMRWAHAQPIYGEE